MISCRRPRGRLIIDRARRTGYESLCPPSPRAPENGSATGSPFLPRHRPPLSNFNPNSQLSTHSGAPRHRTTIVALTFFHLPLFRQSPYLADQLPISIRAPPLGLFCPMNIFQSLSHHLRQCFPDNRFGGIGSFPLTDQWQFRRL